MTHIMFLLSCVIVVFLILITIYILQCIAELIVCIFTQSAKKGCVMSMVCCCTGGQQTVERSGRRGSYSTNLGRRVRSQL